MSSMPLGKATMPQKAPDIDEPQIARFLGPGRTPILRRSFQKRSQKDQNEAMGSKRPDARTDMDGLDDISKSLLQQSRSSDPTGSYGSLLQACSIAKNDTKEGVSSSDCSGTTPAAATTSGPWLDSEQSGTNDLNSPASGLMSLLHDTVRNKPISPTISTTPNNLGTTSFEDDGTSLSELSHASEAETERLNDEESLETPVGLYDASESLTSLNETPVTYQSPASAASSTGKRKRSIPEVDAYEPLSEEKPVPDTAFRLQDELDGETEAKLEDFALKALDQPPASILMGEKEGMEAEEEEDETMAQSEQVESGAEEDEAQDQEVVDDTEERAKMRRDAMEKLREIEVQFATLRSTLYEEKSHQLEKEIELVNSGEHPNLNEKAEQNVTRHQKRIRLADALLVRKKAEIDIEFKAKRFAAFSQHAQDRQKLRAFLLSRTSAEWFQIHREKRILDMAVPDYGYMVSDRPAEQVKYRLEYEMEVSLLAGLKKYVGFPAAPPVSSATKEDIVADLGAMDISSSRQLTVGSVAPQMQTPTVSVQPQHPLSPSLPPLSQQPYSPPLPSQHLYQLQYSIQQAPKLPPHHHHHHHHHHIQPLHGIHNSQPNLSQTSQSQLPAQNANSLPRTHLLQSSSSLQQPSLQDQQAGYHPPHRQSMASQSYYNPGMSQFQHDSPHSRRESLSGIPGMDSRSLLHHVPSLQSEHPMDILHSSRPPQYQSLPPPNTLTGSYHPSQHPVPLHQHPHQLHHLQQPQHHHPQHQYGPKPDIGIMHMQLNSASDSPKKRNSLPIPLSVGNVNNLPNHTIPNGSYASSNGSTQEKKTYAAFWDSQPTSLLMKHHDKSGENGGVLPTSA